MSTLVLAAHPDDEVLGCGGTIARLVDEGREVYIAILGEGISSRYEERTEADPGLIRTLHGNSRSVAEFLGAKDLFMYNLPDNCFDTVPMLEVVKIVEGLINDLRPTTVYTQHGGDLNVDHNVLFRATVTATRPIRGCPVRELFAYEVASSTEWAFQKFEPAFRPSVFVDIGGTIDHKVRAMQMYESEARVFPHPRSPESLRAAASRWGSVVGSAAAEAFEPVRLLR
jgi:LmbE family N-acetylglucosaminyl deacetylase